MRNRVLRVLLIGLLGFALPGFTRDTRRAEQVWRGKVNVGGTRYAAELWRVPSRPGIRTAIDQALALVIRAPSPSGAVLIEIGGGRNGRPNSSFAGQDRPLDGRAVVNHIVNNKNQLEEGTTLVFAEYRGSINPGGPNYDKGPSPGNVSVFSPPLPRYGDLLRGYDTYEASEWGHGDVEDVVSVVQFVQGGGIGPASPLYVIGASHGGYLALEIAHRVPGIKRVAAVHGPTGAPGMVEWYRNPPATRFTYKGAAIDLSPRSALNLLLKHFNVLERGMWPNGREAFVQRVLRQGGGEREFLYSQPGCQLYRNPPLLSEILLITDINDYVVPVMQSRNYYRRWKDSHPGIHLLEFMTEETGLPVMNSLVTHYSPAEAPVIAEFLRSGTTPQLFAGPVPATVRGKVVDAETNKPVAGAIVALEEGYSGCGPEITTYGGTDSSGEVSFQDIPGGFLTARVSHNLYKKETYTLYLVRGMNDLTSAPVRLERLPGTESTPGSAGQPLPLDSSAKAPNTPGPLPTADGRPAVSQGDPETPGPGEAPQAAPDPPGAPAAPVPGLHDAADGALFGTSDDPARAHLAQYPDRCIVRRRDAPKERGYCVNVVCHNGMELKIPDDSVNCGVRPGQELGYRDATCAGPVRDSAHPALDIRPHTVMKGSDSIHVEIRDGPRNKPATLFIRGFLKEEVPLGNTDPCDGNLKMVLRDTTGLAAGSYQLSARVGDGEFGNSSLTVVESGHGLPTCTLSFEPKKIGVGEGSVLRWSASQSATRYTFNCPALKSYQPTGPLPVEGKYSSEIDTGPQMSEGTFTCTASVYSGKYDAQSCKTCSCVSSLVVEGRPPKTD